MGTCFRSTWRLHEDPTILTKGRHYRAAAGAPCVTSATYLGSRDYSKNKYDQPHGEWGGERFYDLGIPPHLPPQNQPIGGDCLDRLRPTPAPDDAQAVNRGRCVHLPNRELCGNVPLYANFSLAYETGIITYYRNVPNYLTKDDGEGEWSGAVPGLVDPGPGTVHAVTRIRVTENDDEEHTLNFRFAVCDNLGGVTDECGLCPGGASDPWIFAIAGTSITWPGIDPGVWNRTWVIPHNHHCFWDLDVDGVHMQVAVALPFNWLVTATIGGVEVFRYTVFLDCFGPVTLALVSNDPAITGLPATVFMHG